MKSKLKTVSILLILLTIIFSCSQPITEVGSYVDQDEFKRKQTEVIIAAFPETKGGNSWDIKNKEVAFLTQQETKQFKHPERDVKYAFIDVWETEFFGIRSSTWPDGNNMISFQGEKYRLLTWVYGHNWPYRHVPPRPELIEKGYYFWWHSYERYNLAYAVNESAWKDVTNKVHDMGYIAPVVVKSGNEYLLYYTQNWREYIKPPSESNLEHWEYKNHYKTFYNYSTGTNSTWYTNRSLTFLNDLKDDQKKNLPYLDMVRGGQIISSVQEYDGYLQMWYAGQADHSAEKGNATWRIFYSRVEDMANKENWTTISDMSGKPMIAIDASLQGFEKESIGKTAVLKVGGKFQQWFTGFDGKNYKIGYASSPNGLNNWLKKEKEILAGTPGKFDRDGVADPFLIHEDNIYKMWYAGRQIVEENGQKKERWQLGLQYSHDGINFRYYDQNNYTPLKLKGLDPKIYDIRYPMVIREGNTYKIWFSYRDSTKGVTTGRLPLPEPWKIGYAESPVTP